MSLLLAAGLATVAVGHHARRAAGGRRAVPRRVRQRHLGRRHERRGRRGRAAPGALDHVALPRRLQPRHGRRRAARARRWSPSHVGVDRPPDRRRGGRRRGRADLRCAASCPALPHEHAAATAGPPRHPLQAWTEPRTLLIGLFVLAMAFTEGTGNDWLGVAVIDGYDAAAGRRLADVRGVRRRDDRRPLVRHRPARPLRPRARAAGLGRSRPWSGCVLVVFGTGLPMAMAGAVAVGPRRRARLPRRHERRRRRPPATRPGGSASSPRSATSPSSPGRR